MVVLIIVNANLVEIGGVGRRPQTKAKTELSTFHPNVFL